MIQTVEITLHYGYAIGGAQVYVYDNVEDAIAYMKTLGQVEKRSERDYYIHTERSTFIPVTIKQRTFL